MATSWHLIETVGSYFLERDLIILNSIFSFFNQKPISMNAYLIFNIVATTLNSTSTSAFTSYSSVSGSLTAPSTAMSSSTTAGVLSSPSPCHKGCGGLLHPGLASCTSCGPTSHHPALQSPHLPPRTTPAIYDPHNPLHPFIRHPYFTGMLNDTFLSRNSI